MSRGKIPVVIVKLCLYYKNIKVKMSVYMAWERLADNFPFDYVLPEE